MSAPATGPGFAMSVEGAYLPDSGAAPGRGGRSRRNRRGRGIRGPLLPPGLPGYQTRGERFDELVLAAMQRLELLMDQQVAGIEFAVENVPPITDPTSGVPLGRLFPRDGEQAPRVVVYRRPVEARAHSYEELHDLVFDVVIEQVALIFGRRPEEIDPEYGGEY